MKTPAVEGRSSRLSGRPAIRAALGVAALVTLVAVGLKAAGLVGPAPPSPRAIGARILAEPAAAATAAPLFTDVAGAMGLSFVHDNGARGNYHLPEQMGPGAGFLDHDGDGDLDVFVTGGGAVTRDGPAQSCRLFRNDGGRFTDVTEESGAGVSGPAYGVACADYDEDSDTDILVTRLGPDVLLRNDGRGRFEDVSVRAGIADGGFGTSAAFFDYDRDGRLDLYVAHYVDWSPTRTQACFSTLGGRDYCNPMVFRAPSPGRLYRNRGDGSFEDVSIAAGIAAEAGNGLGVLASDFDGDGHCDVYVANDQTPGFFWHNRGDGTFENEAVLRGCAYDAQGVAIAGMGVAAEDLEGDGDFDLFVTNIRGQMHLVLENRGSTFADQSAAMGLGRWSTAPTGFGVVLFDQDNDGALDAAVANGAVNVDPAAEHATDPYAEPMQFVRWVDGAFLDRTAEAGTFAGIGRGLAAADFDDDGDLDLLLTQNGGPLRLLRNDNATGNHWIAVDARTGEGGRPDIGARVRVTAGRRSLVREIRPQQSYLTSGDPRAHFGLGRDARVDAIDVLWADGTTSTLRDPGVDRVVVLTRRGSRAAVPR